MIEDSGAVAVAPSSVSVRVFSTFSSSFAAAAGGVDVIEGAMETDVGSTVFDAVSLHSKKFGTIVDEFLHQYVHSH